MADTWSKAYTVSNLQDLCSHLPHAPLRRMTSTQPRAMQLFLSLACPHWWQFSSFLLQPLCSFISKLCVQISACSLAKADHSARDIGHRRPWVQAATALFWDCYEEYCFRAVGHGPLENSGHAGGPLPSLACFPAHDLLRIAPEHSLLLVFPLSCITFSCFILSPWNVSLLPLPFAQFLSIFQEELKGYLFHYKLQSHQLQAVSLMSSFMLCNFLGACTTFFYVVL